MSVKQVILFCNYTSSTTRSHLHLSELKFDNWIRRLCGVAELEYFEAAPWIEAFIRFFQCNENFHLHIVALQMGMRKEVQDYEEDGVSYHYVKSGMSFGAKILDKFFSFQRKRDYPIYRRRFARALSGTVPDILMLCGAENPDYATAFLYSTCPRKLVVLQTLMNDSKRIAMGVSTDFRREIENKVIRDSNYFAVPDVTWIHYVKSINPNATCFPFTFPTIEPKISQKTNKQFDFVFFAGKLARNKGTNDLVSALSMVVINYPFVSLNIIGSANDYYMNDLRQQIQHCGLENNVVLTPSFPVRDDVFNQVVKSKCAILPGITASLNSTVREAMLIGMPTITYETADTKLINQHNPCILTARMEDISDLANKMEFALRNPEDMSVIANNGERYAKTHFSQEAFNSLFDGILTKVL